MKNKGILANNKDSLVINISNKKASLFTITGYCANINTGGFSFTIPYRAGYYMFPIYNYKSIIYLLGIQLTADAITMQTFYSANTSLSIYISYVTMFY